MKRACPILQLTAAALCIAFGIVVPVNSTASQGSTMLERAAVGDLATVRTLAKGSEAASIREIASELAQARSNAEGERIRNLRKSLASLGDPEARSAIRLDLKNDDLYTMASAFQDAQQLGGDDMLAALGEMLFDNRPGGRPPNADGSIATDVAVAAPRFLAVVALSHLIDSDDAPRIDLKRIMYREEDVERWRAWWKASRIEYGTSDR